MKIDAIFEDGVFRPLDQVKLPNKFPVRLSFEPAKTVDEDRPLMRLVKILERHVDEDTTPPDYSEQLDHYLYGTPKRT
jgi:predicted DNA-binding antitoxin AbrB/MazE fold protein